MTLTTAKKKFLICDDESEILDILKDVLHLMYPGSMVISAGDGLEAMLKIQRQHFDLMITDMKMPKRDGVRLIRAVLGLHESQRPRKILVLTGHAPEEDIGPIPVLIKPCTQEVIQDAIKKLMPGNHSPPKQGPKIDLDFVNPIISAVSQVMETTTNTPAKKKRVFVRSGDQLQGDISALISVSAPTCRGSMALTFTEPCFLKIVESMLGEKHASISPENSDAAGEICNQVFGLSKRALNESGYQIQPALPSVISGKNHTIRHLASGPVVVLEFECGAGVFFLEVCVEQS